MQKSLLHTLLICFFAFVGGVFSDQILRAGDTHADIVPDLLGNDGIKFGEIYKDGKKRKRIVINSSEGAPIQEFFGADGTRRLQVGTYQGEESPSSDAGLPLISLMDRQGQMRMLFRITQGKNQSPVMVLKDSKGNDRVVLGLAINADSEEPFLAYYDKLGGKHLVFGNF